MRASALVLLAALVVTACGSGSAGPQPPSTTVVYRFGVVGNRGAISQLQLDRPTPVPGITGQVVQIATSNSDGYTLTSSGAVWAWGVASYGELGNGTRPAYSTRAIRVQFRCGVRIVSLANPMPFDGALAINDHGHVWGWGLNVSGDLCLSGLTELRPSELPLSGINLATGARRHARSSHRVARSTPVAPVSTGSSAPAPPRAAPRRSRSSACRARCQ